MPFRRIWVIKYMYECPTRAHVSSQHDKNMVTFHFDIFDIFGNIGFYKKIDTIW